MQRVLESPEIQELGGWFSVEDDRVFCVQLSQMIKILLLPCPDMTPVAAEKIFPRVVSHGLKTIPKT